MPRQNRSSQICLHECRSYHVISRCTRQLHILGGDDAQRNDRKAMLLRQLERVATFTAVGVAGFAVMDNHVHLLLKVDSESAREWSPREVARRWLGLHPPRDGYRRRVDVEDEHIEALLADPTLGLVASLREKLMSISQFMKEFKQEVTQAINVLEDTIGSVWAGRFKAGRVTDEAQLLTTLVYIDLNPFAAGLCDTPEAGHHTSLAARLRGKVDSEGNEIDAAPESRKPPAASSTSTPAEHSGWWMNVGGGEPGAAHRGRAIMPDTTLTFGAYLKLLDRTARLLRKGKRALARDFEPILARLTTTPAGLATTLQAWFERGLPWERPRTAT